MGSLFNIEKPDTKTKRLAKKALKDQKFLEEMLENMTAKDEQSRFSSFKALIFLSDKHPKLLYPHWDHFTALLKSDNAFHRIQPVFILANLSRSDPQSKFDKIFDKYFELLNDKKIMIACHLASNTDKIFKAKPKLRLKIIKKLLNVEKTYPLKNRADYVKTNALDTFSSNYQEIPEKEKIIKFAETMQNSDSPRARKAAKKFLKRVQ
ncbi:hypothetical protein JW766_00720 [Candidatus Dojkabacteria bacterium]|nr:hypothetical protein [Candidatus Dojkabacteria bacterium]